MRLWIVGGGTGGHVYPALAVAQALRGIAPDVELTWVGTLDGMEGDLVRREGFSFVGIPGGGLHGVALLNAIRNGWQLVRGTWAAVKHVQRERPAAVLTTGGYVSGPVATAARLHGVPILVFAPDIEPARSVKAVARMADRVAITVEDTLRYISREKAVVTGYPLGERITRWTRAEGRAALGVDENAPMLFVFGGSRGARSINRAVMQNIDALSEVAYVVHVSGTLDWPEVEAAQKALPAAVRSRYQVAPYLHEEMGGALAAADLVVSRAGASILGEFPYFGLPSVLVPYPHAWRYQRVNAGWLEDRSAAVIVEDAALPGDIVPVVTELLAEKERLGRMADASRKLARPRAAAEIAQLFLELGQG